MKYLHFYDTEAKYEAVRNGEGYVEPWVSYTEENTEVNYNKSEYERLLETPLTTIAKENGAISFNIWKSMGTDMITSVSYSTDGGETWTTTNNTDDKSGHLAITVNVNEGDRVMWKADARQTSYWDEDDYGDYVGSFFSSTCEFDVEGNVMSMINDATGLTYDGQLSCLFRDYNEVIECLVVDASKLLLPATTLTNDCYKCMFSNCTSLTTAPELPATTLANSCYIGMFISCRSLASAPELPATRLADYCYSEMFYGCTSLASAPELPAATLARSCYLSMFNDCTSLASAPELPATTLTNDCYSYMFNGCTSLTVAPELPATALVDSCYYSMFGGCTSLTTAPELPATTLAYACYSYMFNGCISLTTAPELPATSLTPNCYSYMFQDCRSLTTAPELPATTLANSCYSGMFQRCSRLNYIKCLAATNVNTTNCNSWVTGVSSTGTFVKAASMTGWTEGNNGIPAGWTVQDA